ncbi:MAG: YceI family protein [Gammaproteobacteria bacterium]
MRILVRSLLVAALLAGCTQAPVPPVLAPTGDILNWYRGASAREPIYKIDSARSLIAVTVRRGGPFARFGHDHVVASHTVEGLAAPRTGRADFYFRLDQLSVDEKPLRDAAGLDTEPSEDAIAGTRNNMLTRVLEAEHYPVVQLHAQRIAAQPDKLKLSITLHGVTRSYEVPTRIEQTDSALTASGALTLLQSDFAIKPMSIMGGALTVQDALEVRFTLVARPRD